MSSRHLRLSEEHHVGLPAQVTSPAPEEITPELFSDIGEITPKPLRTIGDVAPEWLSDSTEVTPGMLGEMPDVTPGLLEHQ